jgi:hypothetical protein
MASYTITISVTGNGNFTYDPTLLRAERGDKITFECETGPFEAVFRHQSPGNRLFVSSAHPLLVILTNAPYAIYHYAAAVYNPSENRVYIDAGCGDIAIET